MIKFKTKANKIIILLICINFLLSPSSGLGLANADNSSLNQKIALDDALFSSILSEQKNINNFRLKEQLNDKNSIFDDSLKVFLANLSLTRNDNPKNVKIIVLFDEDTKKEDRINLIDLYFEDYQVLSNYDIIPGTYLSCNPFELIGKENLFGEISAIQKIYKSKTFKTPVIKDYSPTSDSLDNGSFSNWWLSTIGAHLVNYDGTGVKVAVIDSGIYDHPDLDIINNENFVTDEDSYNDANGHGTHVAGIIGSSGNGSSNKYQGIAPGVSLINARAGDATGSLLEGDIVDAIDWCAKKEDLGGAEADIISLSIGGGYPDASDAITSALSVAVGRGIICVASAGNSGPGYFTGSSPASGVNVIAVGATDKNDDLVSFSSWGPVYSYLGYPDVVAPGVNIISTEAKDSVISKEKRFIGDYFDFYGDADYIPLSGTSMSCPIVSGALAILKQAYPKMTPQTARIALLEGAQKLENNDNDDFLKSGAGLINISASYDFLFEKNKTNVNDIAKIFPDVLPIKPYELLSFPGDYQEFDLTVISGEKSTFNVSIPNNIEGVSLSLDKTNTSGGIDFISLGIKIENEAEPGIRNFQLNLTKGGTLYKDVNVDITLEIRMPEHLILMESYHGMNDLFPEFSYYQIGFYDAMNDIAKKDISIDYGMEYWTPNYDVDKNNSLLTEEKLAQYDLIVLQNPILPYSSLEVDNLKNYFDNGGNILFLGTRYQELCSENINHLFYTLGLDIQINDENIMDDSWLGIGASVSEQSVTEFNAPSIFDDVDKFSWYYGNSFTTSENQSIATIGGKTVAAIYNRTSLTRGNFVAFGDLHWLFDGYNSTGYSQDHEKLLNNLMEYLLPEDDISINIGLSSERTSISQFNISVHAKDQATDVPINSITLKNFINVTIENDTFSQIILMESSTNGTAINKTYNLPYPSYIPYTIRVNLTIDSKTYNKTSKILYYDETRVPNINSLSVTAENVTRRGSISLRAGLDNSTYNVTAYLAIYSGSFYNTQKTVNKTFTLTNISSTTYACTFAPSSSDPSGNAVFYVLPLNSSSNYTNPNSPRYYFPVINHDPNIVEANSTFSYGTSGNISFSDTSEGGSIYIYTVSQKENFTFNVVANESVNYEDKSKNMRVFVNFFICSVSEEGYLMLIYPKTFEVEELKYNSVNRKHEGNFTIPENTSYSSINGTRTKTIPTETDYEAGGDYIAIMYITVYDSEGGSDDFIIALSIPKEEVPLDMVSFIIIIIIIIIIIASIIGITILILKKRRSKKFGEFYAPPQKTDSTPPLNEEY